jgi:hypothetical protein
MTIQAKNLEVGQTVKVGNVWVNIEKIGYSKQKNGKDLVNIMGTLLAGIVRRAGGYKHQIEEVKDYGYSIKSLTKVNVK